MKQDKYQILKAVFERKETLKTKKYFISVEVTTYWKFLAEELVPVWLTTNAV